MKRFLGQKDVVLLHTAPPQGPPSSEQTLHCDINFLFLPALQRTQPAKEFFGAAIRFLSQAHTAQPDPSSDGLAVAVSPAYMSAWDDICELWFLGMQALAGCIPLFPWLPHATLQAHWLHELSQLLSRVSPASVDLELVTAFQAVLVELARASEQCRNVILSHHGTEWANLYGMAALEQCLAEQGGASSTLGGK